MLRVRNLAILGAALLLIGCKHEPSIVGEWTATVMKGTANFTFAADKTVTVVQEIPQLGPVNIKGTYEQETADTLTIKFTSADFKPTGNATVDGAIRSGLEPLKSKPAKFTMVWKEDKQIDLTPTDAPQGMNSKFTLMRK